MFDISPTIALAVFVSAFVLDFLYARYTYYIISMKAEMAATISFVWHMLSATVVVQYAENSAYILFLYRRNLGNLPDRLAAATRVANRRRGHAGLITPAAIGSARKHSAWPARPARAASSAAKDVSVGPTRSIPPNWNGS